MPRGTTIQRLIDHANAILPGIPAPEDEIDPRWQAVIRIGRYVETHPEEIWPFVCRWGKHAQSDLRAAISTCLLEHLLEYHFDLLFPLVQAEATKSVRFADTFHTCWLFGQAKLPENASMVERLKRRLRRQYGKRLR